jgi:hypothetical protein
MIVCCDSGRANHWRKRLSNLSLLQLKFFSTRGVLLLLLWLLTVVLMGSRWEVVVRVGAASEKLITVVDGSAREREWRERESALSD